MLAAKLIDEMYGEDIYASAADRLKDMTPDLQGWGGHQFLLKVIETMKPKVVIEVGVWKGRSAIAMAGMLKETNPDSCIICIDTWLGAQEHFQEKFRPDMNRLSGYPRLYDQFMFNVLQSGHKDVIVPIPLSSLAAAQRLKKMDLKADLIHIDAGHGYLEVKSDIDAFWPLLSDNGVMVFDDYAGWQGVTQAVNEFAAEKGLPLIGTHGKALMSPSQNHKFRTTLVSIDETTWKPKRG